jgi:hypothetical protein
MTRRCRTSAKVACLFGELFPSCGLVPSQCETCGGLLAHYSRILLKNSCLIQRGRFEPFPSEEHGYNSMA